MSSFSTVLLLSLTSCRAANLNYGLFYRERNTTGAVLGNQWASVEWSGLRAISDWNEGNATIIPSIASAKAACGEGLTLKGSLVDTQSSEAGSISGYRGLDPRPHVVVGPARSACSTPIALLGGIDQVISMSYWSTSPRLDDKLIYPYFHRTIPSDTKSAIAVVDFFASQNFERATAIYV